MAIASRDDDAGQGWPSRPMRSNARRAPRWTWRWCWRSTAPAASASSAWRCRSRVISTRCGIPSFIEAVRGGRRGRIGLTFVTWTDARRQDQVVPLAGDRGRRPARTPSPRRCRTRCARCRAGPRSAARSTSAPGCCSSNGYIATRRVIDISGDGANNDGRPVTEARDAAVAAGRHHQRPADRRGRAEPGGILPRQRHRRPRLVRRGRARHRQPSARRCCASCWSRSPASSRPARPEHGGRLHQLSSAARTVTASSCRRYGLRIVAPARPCRLVGRLRPDVAGGEQHLQPGPELPRRGGQLVAGHAVRHDHVGEQQIEAVAGQQDLQRRRPAVGLADPVAERHEMTPCHRAHFRVVIHQQDRLVALRQAQSVGFVGLVRLRRPAPAADRGAPSCRDRARCRSADVRRTAWRSRRSC